MPFLPPNQQRQSIEGNGRRDKVPVNCVKHTKDIYMQLSVTFVAVTILFKSSLFAALSGRLKSTLLRKTG